MRMKSIILAAFLFSISTVAIAADVDDAAPPAADGKSSPSGATSFFEGVWVGKWGWAVEGNEVTITVGKKNRKGTFATSYSSEPGRLRLGQSIKPASFKPWGKEQGDRFLIEWKNKEGVKSSVTLIKEKEDSVKAIYDSDGPMPWIRDRSDCITYFKRKR